jgi:metallo-beta-lactamase family protein
MRLTFSGANREVTGSCYHLSNGHSQVVLDCGMFQGGKYAEDRNSQPFPFNPAEVDAMVLTHAHFDHTGRIPKLYKEGFRGKIYCTEPTAELSMLNLRDAVHLMADEAERHGHEPLYTLADVEPLEDLWKTIPYHQEREVVPGIRTYLTDAGHILGSASVRFDSEGKSIAFSGDLGNTPVPLLHATECLTGADTVVIESTYGNRIHEPHTERYSILTEAIRQTAEEKGVLLIPAFALERSQELLYELHHLLITRQIPRMPIYLDSPLAIAATEVFQKHFDYFNTEARVAIERGQELFSFPGLRFTQSSTESKEILRAPGPKIIIAGSGMMNGGRILHHLQNYIERKNTTLLIIGYQVEGSLGRQLHDGAKTVHIYGQELHVNAQVKSFGAFSGHADYPRLMNWLRCFAQQPPRRVFVTHGELNSAISFSQSIEEQLNISSGVPSYGEVIDLT